jgi:hypothetical protein
MQSNPKNILLSIIICIGAILINCKNVTSNEKIDREYIIIPANGAKDDWFLVKNIHSQNVKAVPAVVCITGDLYLPIHSHIPDFNDKVVNGHFIPDTVYYNELKDTIFQVSEHVRDTSLGFYGG